MYKIVLEFDNSNKIDGVGGLPYEECKRRIDDYIAKYPDVVEKENLKFSIIGVDK